MENQLCTCPHDYNSVKRYIAIVKERVEEIIKRSPQTASYIFSTFLEVELILIHIDNALDNNLKEENAEDIQNTKVNIQRHSGCKATKHRRKFKRI